MEQAVFTVVVLVGLSIPIWKFKQKADRLYNKLELRGTQQMTQLEKTTANVERIAAEVKEGKYVD